jgi:hypothetical protein
MQKIILSYREGCSGSWLAELMHSSLCNVVNVAHYRQDFYGIPDSVFHFDGNSDETTMVAITKYQQQPIVTCHSQNQQLLNTLWPNHYVYRIIPSTHVLDAIVASWYKLPPPITNSISLAYEYIRNYYVLHTKQDLRFGNVIDYGDLRHWPTVQQLLNNVGLKLNSELQQFFQDYWGLQKSSGFKTLHTCTMSEVVQQCNFKPHDEFLTAMRIFIYEKANGLLETQRCWSVDNVNLHTDLTSLKYTA